MNSQPLRVTLQQLPRMLTAIMTVTVLVLSVVPGISQEAVIVTPQIPAPRPVTCLAFSPDGSALAAAHGASVELWDLQEARIRNFIEHQAPVISVSFAAATGMVYSLGSDHSLKKTDPVRGTTTEYLALNSGEYSPPFSMASALAVSADGATIAATGTYGVVLSVNGTTRFLSPGFFGYTDDYALTTGHFLRTVALSSDGSRLAVGTGDGKIYWYDIRRNRVVQEFQASDQPANLHVGHDGRILYISTLSAIQMYDTLSRRVVQNISGVWAACSSLSTVKNTLAVTAVDKGPVVQLRDAENGNVKTSIHLMESDYTAVALSGNGRWLAVGYRNGSIRLFDTGDGSWMRLLHDTDTGNWLMHTHDGYWDGSPDSDSLITFSRGTTAWKADQFAAYTNRPDILLERLGSNRADLKRLFLGQHERRRLRLGLADGLFPLPERAPLSRILTVDESDDHVVIVCNFEAGAAGADLVRYTVTVNGVPVTGSGGKSLQGQQARVTETIQLTAGENSIEFQCRDSSGLESARAVAVVEGFDRPPGKLYYVGLAISSYRNSELNLSYPAKDAMDLEQLFLGMAPADSYREVVTKVFVDRQAGRSVISRLAEFVSVLEPEDSLILFLAGHGVLDIDEASTYYFIAWDTDIADVPGTAIPFGDIEQVLYECRARNKLFLLDTCASGERFDPELEALPFRDDADPTAKVINADRSIDIVSGRQAERVLQFPIIDRSRYLFNDIARRSGAVVFSSSRGDEVSYESGIFENGLFTEFLMCGLRGAADTDGDGFVDKTELSNFVSGSVTRETAAHPELYYSLQHPTIDKDNIYNPFRLPVVSSTPVPIAIPAAEHPAMVTLDGDTGRFAIGIHELTNEEYAIFKMRTGTDVTGQPAGRPSPDSRDSTRPVLISWIEAVLYCNWLSEQLGYPPVYSFVVTAGTKKPPEYRVRASLESDGFRLATEEEWVYAARGGNTSQGYRYAGSNSLAEIAWTGFDSYPGLCMPVMALPPNEAGLYDMNGNAAEMVWVASRDGDRVLVRDSEGRFLQKSGLGERIRTKGGHLGLAVDSDLYDLDTYDDHEKTAGLRLVRTVTNVAP